MRGGGGGIEDTSTEDAEFVGEEARTFPIFDRKDHVQSANAISDWFFDQRPY